MNPFHLRAITMCIFKMGRKRPSLAARRLRLADYVSSDLPVPPTVEHWAKGSPGRPSLENIYGNNTLGDCVEAAARHMIGLWRGNAGNLGQGFDPPRVPRGAAKFAQFAGIAGGAV